MTNIRTNFIPSQHGFHFQNRFESALLRQALLPLSGKKSLNSLVYGLCGGMCFAALDHFYAGKPIPSYTQADDIPYRLFRYLWDRQMDSLSASVLTKLLKWMLYADRTIARRVAADEVPELKAELEAGRPVVLALIRVKGLNDPTQNHQVIAVGYDFEESSQGLKISLYDPNHRNASPVLNLSLSHPNQGIDIRQDTGEFLRGFFIIPYTRTAPV